MELSAVGKKMEWQVWVYFTIGWSGKFSIEQRSSERSDNPIQTSRERTFQRRPLEQKPWCRIIPKAGVEKQGVNGKEKRCSWGPDEISNKIL